MAGVYISYPFCNQKCSFCNFASGVAPVQTRAHYDRVLLTELESHEWAWLPETVYLGGGTPSLMPIGALTAVMERIPRTRLAEVTIECAPGTIALETAKAWRGGGIDRVSLGAQSFITAELQQIGRRHTAATVASDVAMLRECGIESINIDLIAGLPQQTSVSWEYSLHWIERLNPPHVSVYIFEVDEHSRLGKEALIEGTRYGAGQLPSDGATVDFYERAVERLKAIGLDRYEISNFARAGWESRHNLKYWLREPYIGFGLDAHSFDGSRRWSNANTIEDYFRQHGTGSSRHRETATVDAAEEHFFVGLRLQQGIVPTEQEWRRFSQPIEKWLTQGMLERDGHSLRLSPRGILISNEIFEEFIGV